MRALSPARPEHQPRGAAIDPARLQGIAHSGEVAREVGVTERTLRRWRAQPAFVDAVRLAARDEHRDATAGLLAAR